ncbi:peptidase inhibitor family I36 protein [Pseudonocardia zijingensis]|jgi:hypothetical protein|uniref:Peptidase inhibitor family I36 n=1 Tax=Pseudonocardia zijingensis TaxID=153376 RepID=A0ABN1QU54_9PSEU
MWRRILSTAAAAVVPLLLLPGSANAGPAAEQESFECAADIICIFDLADGGGDSRTIDISWQGGYGLASSGWADRVSSITNNEKIPLNLLDGVYGGCRILDRIEPGESKNLTGDADDNVDLIDYDSEGDLCPPPQCPDGSFCTWEEAGYIGEPQTYRDLADGCHELTPDERQTRSYMNKGSGLEGYFHSEPGCAGDTRAVLSTSESTDIGFTARSFEVACVSCR